jgi:hypothetical protein
MCKNLNIKSLLRKIVYNQLNYRVMHGKPV